MTIPAHLLTAYEQTTFQADTPVGRLSIRCGRADERLDALLARHGATTWAYITACNPRSRSLSDSENVERQAALMKRLDGRFPVYHGQGVGDVADWQPEPSILVIGVGADQAAEIGREFGQHAVVVGERGGPAELRDCWTLWPAEAPLPTAGAATRDNLDDGCFCRCPLCGTSYRGGEAGCCGHLITDWCFTMDGEPGYPRGYWASDTEGRVLVAVELELRRLRHALDDHKWPKRQRQEFLRGVPVDLNFIRKGHDAIFYDGLLGLRLTATPGYAGSELVNTCHPFASDEWLVHWGQDGPAAARAVDELFQHDLAWLRQAMTRAAGVLGIDESKLLPIQSG